MVTLARWLLAIFALPTLASAQVPTLRIPGTPECAGCRVDVVRIFTVGPIPGAAPARDSYIARDSSGGYVLVVEPGPRVAVLDSIGRFLEFLDWSSTRRGVTAQDVTVRIDRDGAVNIYDGASWTHRFRNGMAFRVGILDDYRVVGTGPMGSPVTTSRPVARPHRSFATLRLRWNPAEPGPFLPTEQSRPATPADQFEVDSVVSSGSCHACADLVLDVALGFLKGAVWAATADQYRVDLFHYWGKIFAQSVEVVDAWLPLRAPATPAPGRTLPEAPRLTGLIFDQNGCTYRSPYDTSKASAGLPLVNPPRDTPCERRLWVAGLTFADTTARDDNLRYATVVDVIGASAWIGPPPEALLTGARVIARTRLPGRVELLGPGLAYQRRQRSDGAWALDVFRLAVRTP